MLVTQESRVTYFYTFGVTEVSVYCIVHVLADNNKPIKSKNTLELV